MNTQATGWRPPIASGPPGTARLLVASSSCIRAGSRSRAVTSNRIGGPADARAGAGRSARDRRGAPATPSRPRRRRARDRPGAAHAIEVAGDDESLRRRRGTQRGRGRGPGVVDGPKLDVARVQELEVAELADLVRQRPTAARAGEHRDAELLARRPRRRRRGPGRRGSARPPRSRRRARPPIASARSSAGPVGSPGSTSTNRRRPTR